MKKKMDITLHRDGRVTYFDVYAQQWNTTRASRIVKCDNWVDSFSEIERSAVINHAEKHR